MTELVKRLVTTLVAEETEDVKIAHSNTVTCALTTTANSVVIILQIVVTAVSVQQLMALMDLVYVVPIYGEISSADQILRSHVVHLDVTLVTMKSITLIVQSVTQATMSSQQ